MLDKVRSAAQVLRDVPHDVYAVLMMLLGTVMSLLGHKDEGMLVLGGGLSVFKGSDGKEKA